MMTPTPEKIAHMVAHGGTVGAYFAKLRDGNYSYRPTGEVMTPEEVRHLLAALDHVARRAIESPAEARARKKKAHLRGLASKHDE